MLILLSLLAAGAFAQRVDTPEWDLLIRHEGGDLRAALSEADLRVVQEGGVPRAIPASKLLAWAERPAGPRDGSEPPIATGDAGSDAPAALETAASRGGHPLEKTPEPRSDASPAEVDDDPIVTYLMIIVAVLLLSLIGVVAYYKTIRPRRLRKPLLAALKIIAENDQSRFEQAEGLISGALGTGLKSSDADEARFALAYVRARLERFTEALSPLRELITIGKADVQARYLYMWLNARQKNEDEVIRIFEEHRAELRGYCDAKKIASIAYLRHANLRWGRKQIEAALASYDQVRKLAELADEIPPGASNHHVVFGIDALVQKELEEARRHFQAALEEAGKTAIEKLEAEAGLLLADWLEEPDLDLDERLGEIVERCRQALPEGRSRHHQTDELEDWRPSDEALLYCGIGLWWALAWIGSQARKPAGSGLTDEAWDDLKARTERVIDEDPTRADAWLIGGLVGYYFSEHHAERRADALERLEKALECGVSVPEVVNLYNHEKRLADLDEHEIFFKTVSGHLQNPSVSDPERKRLVDQLSRYQGMGQRLATVFLDPGVDAPAPIATELRNRSRVLEQRLARVRKILVARGKAPDEATTERLTTSVAELRQAGADVGRELEDYEKAERVALVGTAEALLPEEEKSMVNPGELR